MLGFVRNMNIFCSDDQFWFQSYWSSDILHVLFRGIISRAGMVSICPLLWQRDVKLQQTNHRIFRLLFCQPRWLSGLRRSLVHSLMIARRLYCVLRNWDRIPVRAVKGLISQAGIVSICPLLWQRDVKLQQTKLQTTFLCSLTVTYDWVNRDGCHMWGRKCSLFPEHLISLHFGSSWFQPFIIHTCTLYITEFVSLGLCLRRFVCLK